MAMIKMGSYEKGLNAFKFYYIMLKYNISVML